MTTIQFELGGGASLALPADVVAARLIDCLSSHQAPAILTNARPRIGQKLAGQGGIFVGDILGDDENLYGLIASVEADVGKAKWGPEGARDLSEWDGLGNTNRLCNESPAAKLASEYERDGHCDFYLPARREMMVALANAPGIFAKEGWYWTSTPRLEGYAWAVGFEYGTVTSDYRHYEFRVRPFRRFTA